MQLDLPGRPHLTYCTNIHAGERWDEIARALRTHVPAVKARVAPNVAMGVGLRLSAIAAERLSDTSELARLQEDLRAAGLYIFTINAFPYGPFHGTPVKERVYEPDWRAPERLAFTDRVADILAALLPSGMDGSVSTVPGAFKARVDGRGDIAAIAAAMIAHAAHLHAIAAETGKTIMLALEPEPCCLLDTTDEAIAFFKDHLFGAEAARQFCQLTAVSTAQAETALRRHLTLCFDVCHAAVGFEDVRDSLGRIRDAGIRIAKIQLSSALRLANATVDAETLLRPFDDGVYLHQTVEARDGRLTRFVDLPEAFAAMRSGNAGGEWRVHCHVPLFCASYGALQSTQEVLSEALAVCREREVAPHLEVETYTWGVLPADLRHSDMNEDVARELTWVRSQLSA
jgi:sugar phosphate isomerase/epimerase